jgi:glucose-6-phosphate 1-dehydrogenase
VLKEATPVYVYEPHTWGPKEVDQSVLPPGGWDRPKPDVVPTFK